MYQLFAVANTQRIRALMVRQFRNMVEILRYHREGTLDEHVTVRYTGKKPGADPKDSNNKDDLVSALAITILGAEAFYRRPEFEALRSSLRIDINAMEIVYDKKR